MITINPTMSQLKMLAALRGNLWAVHEGPAVQLALSALELSERVAKEGYYSDEYLSEFYTLRKPLRIEEGIAFVEVRGALLKDAMPIQERVGHAIRYSTVIAETKAALAAGARGIVYEINSPGGTVSGNIEAAEMIADLPIPSVAFCDGLACSAAYKLAAGSSAIISSKSAIVGNIGTIMSWADCSEFWAKWGVNFKAIVSEHATLKSTFHLEPNEEQLAFLQESANEAGKAFRDHVVKGRSAAGAELSEEVWRAGWYSGERAGELGLIDGIGSADDAVEWLKGQIS